MMKQQEITERNCDIAIMLNWKQNSKKSTFYFIKDEKKFIYEHNELKFDRDWNWLMISVEFIENLKFRFDIALNEVDLYCIKEDESRRYSDTINIYEKNLLSKQEAVFIAASNFAKFWNNNKSKNI